MKNFVQPGDTVTITAAAAAVSGEGVMNGVLFGVANADAAIGEEVAISVAGVFDLAKTSAQAWTLGAPIYFIPGSKLCTTATTTGNLFIGVAAAPAANPSGTGRVRLNGSAPTAVA